MIVDYKGVEVMVHERSTSLIAPIPMECKNCHNLTQLFENVRGSTYCWQCVPLCEVQL